MPRRSTTSTVALGLTAVLALLALPLMAQEHEGHRMDGMSMPESGLRAELIRDLEAVEAKYVALAGAMAGRYDWRPAEGVRSVGEVFGHIAAANYSLPGMMGGEVPAKYRGQDGRARLAALGEVTDAETMVAELSHAFMHVRHQIAMVDDARLDGTLSYFGQQGTVRSFLTLLVNHAHEHLGQSIAYARTNGVVPPWNAARD